MHQNEKYQRLTEKLKAFHQRAVKFQKGTSSNHYLKVKSGSGSFKCFKRRLNN